MILSRAKGADGEREAAEFLTSLFKLPVNRTAQYCGAAGHADLEGLAGLHVEVKRRERLHLETALQQATHDASPVAVPVVLHRANRDEWKLTFHAKNLLRFLDVVNRLVEEGHRRALLPAPSPAMPESTNQTGKEEST